MNENISGNISRYTEVETFDEKGILKSKIAYDPGRTNTTGYYHATYDPTKLVTGSTVTSITGLSYNFPDSNVTCDHDHVNHQQFEKIGRAEQMKIARMNTLKEILDSFDNCENFGDVYMVIEKIKKEYDQLSGPNE